MNKENLPYFKIKDKEKETARFFSRKFKARIREKIPQHYLVEAVPLKTLQYIKENSKKYPYFLCFDIKTYYPSIDHHKLLKETEKNYKRIAKKECSRRFKQQLKKNVPSFLSRSPYNKGLPLGSPLSHILSAIFLLNLDLKLNKSVKFLRFADDYLLFCKKKKDPQRILKELIVPELERLSLEINEKKLSSGKFHQDKVEFIGFVFHRGHFYIKEKKTEEFEKRISKATYLTKKKPLE